MQFITTAALLIKFSLLLFRNSFYKVDEKDKERRKTDWDEQDKQMNSQK